MDAVVVPWTPEMVKMLPGKMLPDTDMFTHILFKAPGMLLLSCTTATRNVGLFETPGSFRRNGTESTPIHPRPATR